MLSSAKILVLLVHGSTLVHRVRFPPAESRTVSTPRRTHASDDKRNVVDGSASHRVALWQPRFVDRCGTLFHASNMV